MRSYQQPLAIALLLALGACTTPATQRPSVGADEIRAEQTLEQNAALNNPFPPIIEPVYPNNKMKARLATVAARVNPHASKLCYQLRGGPRDDLGCHYSLAIKGTRGVNAYADGTDVVITAPMMLFAAKDTHLAFVLAHELAHNIMEHIDSASNNALIGTLFGAVADIAAGATGASTNGTFSKMGGNIALETYSPSFEAEADYIALYILARAGYRIEEAPNFWRAMAQYEPQGIYARGSHPTTAERFVAMNKTITEIRAKQRSGQPLIPNIRSK